MTATEREHDNLEFPEDPNGASATVWSASSAPTTVFASMRETWKYRGFIGYMTKRHLRVTYLRSYFGWFWSLINPIAEVAIYTFVFGSLLGVNRAIPDAPNGFNSFPHFLLSGLAVWGFYRTVSGKVLNSFAETVKLRRKLYFPPAAAALSNALGTLVEAGVLVVVVVLFYGLWGHLTIHAIVLIPAALFAAVSGLGVGLALSVACLLYTSPSPRDLSTSRMPSSA